MAWSATNGADPYADFRNKRKYAAESCCRKSDVPTAKRQQLAQPLVPIASFSLFFSVRAESFNTVRGAQLQRKHGSASQLIV
jgi:hypothetical protein